jgi:hypothetical protein
VPSLIMDMVAVGGLSDDIVAPPCNPATWVARLPLLGQFLRRRQYRHFRQGNRLVESQEGPDHLSGYRDIIAPVDMGGGVRGMETIGRQ